MTLSLWWLLPGLALAGWSVFCYEIGLATGKERAKSEHRSGTA